MDVSRETWSRLERYQELLTSWNRRLNLVSRLDIGPNFRTRHILDSLGLIRHFPETSTAFTDLGSGGGLPAIPIGLVLGHRFTMIESDRRKAAFLQTAVATLGLEGKVLCERAETTTAERATCITARALGPLDALLPLAHRLLAPSGVALFLKGPNVAAEIEVAKRSWEMDVQVFEGASPRSCVVRIGRLQRASAEGP